MTFDAGLRVDAVVVDLHEDRLVTRGALGEVFTRLSARVLDVRDAFDLRGGRLAVEALALFERRARALLGLLALEIRGSTTDEESKSSDRSERNEKRAVHDDDLL